MIGVKMYLAVLSLRFLPQIGSSRGLEIRDSRRQAPGLRPLWSLMLGASLVLGGWILDVSSGATITVTTNRIGLTPSIVGYNAGHFAPGSNTKDWWRYSGTTGARVFISPDNIEP